jgi:uncharacterized membrane protein YphA (DoxX/SURF4 family)
LRAAAGTAALVEGGGYFAPSEGASLTTWAIGLIVILSAAALLAGFLTPLASAFVALTSFAITCGWIAPPVLNLLESRVAALLVVTIASAAACLGPGAFSIDARLFGRREVLIRT